MAIFLEILLTFSKRNALSVCLQKIEPKSLNSIRILEQLRFFYLYPAIFFAIVAM